MIKGSRRHSGLRRLLISLLSVVLLVPPFTPAPEQVYADSVNNATVLSHVDTMKSLYNTNANTLSSENEVSSLTGVLRVTATDLVFPGRNGLDLALTRIYSSRDSNLSNPKAVTTNTSSPFYYTNDSTTDKYTHNEKRYNLGAGWSFALPSIEFRGSDPFLHFADGSVYRITGSGSSRTIEGYPLQDVAFATASTAIGGLTAAYQLSDTNKTTQYFDSAGKWIGTRDAYNNEITVAYADQPIFGGTASPVIQSITSTGNRVISFAYPDANTVSVTYPIDGTKTGKLVYTKSAISGQTNEMQLSSVDSFIYIDTANSANNQKLTTAYSYTSKTAAFDYESADTSKPNGSLTYQLLTKVTYPTGASSNYGYEAAAQKKFLGANGYLEFYRIAERYDSLKGPTGAAQKTQYTKYTYEAGKNFSGYGTAGESNPDSLSAGFSVTNNMRTFTDPDTVAPSQDRLVESLTYNNKHLLTTYTAEKQGEYKESTTYAYDATLELPLSVRQSYYSIDGSEASSYTDEFYTYDTYGNVLTYTNPKSYKSTYTYHSTFRSIPVTKETTYGLTTGSPVTEKFVQTVSSTKPEVSKSEQKYKNKPTDSTELTDTTEYTYDTYGNVRTVKLLLENNRSQLTTYTYDSNGLFPLSVKQNVTKNGTTRTVEQKYEYTSGTGWEKSYLDPNAVKAGTSAAASRKYETEYDLIGRVSRIKSSMIAGETAKPERTFTYTYNTSSQTYTTQGVDEEGNKTISLYDGLGRIREVKAPAANTVMDSTTASHSPVTKQSYTYSGLGEVISVKDALNRTTSYDYDNVGRVKQSTTPLGQMYGASYNDMLRSVTTTSPITLTSSATIESQSDELGRMTSTKQLNSDPTQSDILQRSAAYEVGSDPFRSQTTDANGNQTSYQGNGLGLLSDLTQTVNGLEQTSTYGYNKLRQLTSKSVDGQIQSSYEYDERGQRTTKADPTNGTETYGYDDNGNLVEGTDRLGNPAEHTYDERNQLTAWNYGSTTSAVTASFTYFKNGLRKSMTDETGTTQYQYNRDSTLRKVTYPDGKTISYEYNESGTRKSMTDPFGAITLYTYDNDDRLTKVSLKENSSAAEATQAQYAYAGSVLDTITYGNGLVTQYLYEDGFGRLTGLKHMKGSTVLNQYSYTYDNNGNITQRSSNGQSVTFGYDELNRIISNSEANEQYSYDKKGNRLTLLSTSPDLHTDTMVYTYDKANQLKSVNRNGSTTTYKYDGDGLMRERNNGSTSRFYYDGENIIAEASVSGSTVSFKARYVRGYQLLSVKNQWGTVGYYLENGHGDVVNLYKQDQSLLNTYDYDIWGNPTVTEEADQYGNAFTYSGEYWDTGTSLQYLRARWYDPSIGRFITEDTWEGRVNHPDSQNPYIYVINNPLIYVDPSGNWCSSTVNGKVYSHPGACNNGVVGEEDTSSPYYIPDDNATNFGRTTINNGVAGNKWYPEGAFRIGWDKTGISDAFIGCAYDSQCFNFVTGSLDLLRPATAVKNPCNCFTAETKVLTDEGEKNIEDIQVGDKVLSKDEETGEETYKEVTATFNHETDEIYKIHVGGQTIESTYNHPFYVEGKGWTFVKDLKVGDLLVQSDGNTLKIENIELLHKHVTVYNMTVDEFHTYFVSDLGIWVHNTGPCNIYNGIKNAPKYPEGFTAAKNGTVGNTVKNKELLDKLREIEPGEWKKVYKDGYDANGRKVSIHYFQSKSGKVFDVDVKLGWSNSSSQ